MTTAQQERDALLLNAYSGLNYLVGFAEGLCAGFEHEPAPNIPPFILSTIQRIEENIESGEHLKKGTEK